MKILITGGTGNLAQYLIPELEKDHELVLFDRVEPGKNRIAYEVKHPYVQGELTNGEDVARAVQGCDAIMHLAAIRFASDNPDTIKRVQARGEALPPYNATMHINTMGTYEVLYAAAQAKVKTVITVTSNCVLGHIMRMSDRPFPIHYLPFDEEHPTDPEDSYSLSKQFQEELMWAFAKAYGLRCYAIRPAGIVRPEVQEERAKEIGPATSLTDSIINGYNDIADVARALRMCLDASPDLPQWDAYFINADDTWALEDSDEIVRKFRPDLVPKIRDLSGKSPFISNKKAKKAFGWAPQYSWRRFLKEPATASAR